MVSTWGPWLTKNEIEHCLYLYWGFVIFQSTASLFKPNGWSNVLNTIIYHRQLIFITLNKWDNSLQQFFIPYGDPITNYFSLSSKIPQTVVFGLSQVAENAKMGDVNFQISKT